MKVYVTFHVQHGYGSPTTSIDHVFGTWEALFNYYNKQLDDSTDEEDRKECVRYWNLDSWEEYKRISIENNDVGDDEGWIQMELE